MGHGHRCTSSAPWFHELRMASGLCGCVDLPPAALLPASQDQTQGTDHRGQGGPGSWWWSTSPAPQMCSLETKRFLLFQECLSPRPGCWPRPPVNYYILIALALMSNHNCGLKVQQIYHFTRSGISRGGKYPSKNTLILKNKMCVV